MEEPFDVVCDEGVQLRGVLTRPPGLSPAPAVLLLSGSGPVDRDTNMPGQSLNIMNAVASQLARHGIASLRYDKRGVGASSGDYLRTGFNEECEDARRAFDALCKTAEVDADRVGLIGHSVGATIAIRIAAARGGVAGVVLLGAPATSGLSVMEWQSRRIAATMPWWWRPRRFLRTQARERTRLLESSGDVIVLSGQEHPARWFREYMHYDPSLDLGLIACPVLAITGQSDVQADAKEVARIGRLVRGPFTGETPEHLSHLLRIDTRPPGLRTYRSQIDQPVDARLIDTITTWLGARFQDRTDRRDHGHPDHRDGRS